MSARIADALDKYFDAGYSGHVTVEKEGFGFRTECVVHLDSGITLHTEANAADAYASADHAAERIEKRLRRYKRRLKDRHAARQNGANGAAAVDAPSYVIAAPQHEGDEEVAEFNPVIIAETTTTLRTALGQRGGAGTRHDRRSGDRVPSRDPRPRERRLSARRRPGRLGRPANHDGRMIRVAH